MTIIKNTIKKHTDFFEDDMCQNFKNGLKLLLNKIYLQLT